MQTTTYKWRKGLFSNTYGFCDSNKKIGFLTNSMVSNNGKSSLLNKQFYFKTSGIFHPKTTIINSNKNEIIGNITYNSWRTKATIKKIMKFIFLNMITFGIQNGVFIIMEILQLNTPDLVQAE